MIDDNDDGSAAVAAGARRRGHWPRELDELVPIAPQEPIAGNAYEVGAEAQDARDLIRHLRCLQIDDAERRALQRVDWALQSIGLRGTLPHMVDDRDALIELATHAERVTRWLQGKPTESLGLRRDLPRIIKHIERTRARLLGLPPAKETT